jgi:predicted RNase H-like nuclease (RuvC/YqgF family)
MKRDELKELGLTDEQIDKVMSSHGQTVQGLQKQVTDLTSERDSFKTQADESSNTIKELQKKAKGNEDAQKAIEEWQKKAEEAQAALTNTQKNNAIELALRDAGALNAKAARALLDNDVISFKDGKLIGIDEQLTSLKEAEDSKFLFKSAEPKEKEVVEPKKPQIISPRGNPDPNTNNGESIADKIAARLSASK